MKKSSFIAPIVIALIMILYYGFIAALFVTVSMPLWAKVLLCVIPLSLIGVVIFVLRERIKELKDGELDDLSKY